MIECRICHCLCDPGDTINGICDDCREETQRQEKAERITKETGNQMTLDEFWN